MTPLRLHCQPQQLDLFKQLNIQLEVPMRTNQHNYSPQPHIIRKTRKRIEIFFSQLCGQFMIQRNFSKSFKGFKTRIPNKITVTTMIQFLNKTVFHRNLNNLKINIAKCMHNEYILLIGVIQMIFSKTAFYII